MSIASPAAAQLVALEDRPLSAVERVRMTALEAQFSRIAAQRNTSLAALRTIARALGGKLTALDPGQVVRIVDDRAQELTTARSRIQEMQGQLDQLDSMRLAKAVSPLLTAARLAIDEGRLADADGQLAQAAARFGEARGNLQAHVERIGAQEADVLAQQAGVRSSLSDFTGAATLYARAAELSEGTRPRIAWSYRIEQSKSLYSSGLEGRTNGVADSVAVLRARALPLAPVESQREEWAATQYRIGLGEMVQSMRTGDVAGMERSVAALRNSVGATTARSPAEDRQLRGQKFAVALAQNAILARSPAALQEAVATLKDVEARERPSTADFYSDYANVYSISADLAKARGDQARAIADVEACIEALTRAASLVDQSTRRMFYIQTRYNIVSSYNQLVVLRRNPADAVKAAGLARDALALFERDQSPFLWAALHLQYGQALVQQNDLQPQVDPNTLALAIAALTSAGEVLTKERWPLLRADAHYAIARGRWMQAGLRPSAESLEPVIASFEEAAMVHNRERAPETWADITVRMAMVRIAQATAGATDTGGAALDQAKRLLADAKPVVLASTSPTLKQLYAQTEAALKAAR